MGGTRTTTIAGFAVAALLGLGGCGGDDDGGAAIGTTGPEEVPAQPEGDVPEGSGAVAEACGLLEVAEIEQQFGDLGTVHDGEPTALGCSWLVGEEIEDAPAQTELNLQIVSASATPEEALAEVRSHPDAVDVTGVGDEAVYDFGVFYVRSGEVLVAIQAYMIPGVELGSETLKGQLVTLAEQALARM